MHTEGARAEPLGQNVSRQRVIQRSQNFPDNFHVTQRVTCPRREGGEMPNSPGRYPPAVMFAPDFEVFP